MKVGLILAAIATVLMAVLGALCAWIDRWVPAVALWALGAVYGTVTVVLAEALRQPPPK